jgi:hypothetical protein
MNRHASARWSLLGGHDLKIVTSRPIYGWNGQEFPQPNRLPNLSISQILQKSPDDRLFVHDGTSFQHGIGEVFIPARSDEAVSRQPQHGLGLS